MAHIIADRVKETTETTGTGQLTLLGASTGTRTFNSQMANNDTCYYCIDGGSTGQWEVGLGTYADADLLTRTTIYANSNGDTAAVNFSAGVKDVFITNPAYAITNLPNTINGTFTPVLSGTTTAGVGTYSTQDGIYSLIGKVCTFSCAIVISAHTGTGGMKITNLPYTCSTVSTPCAVATTNLTFTGIPFGMVGAGSTELSIFQNTTNVGVSYVPMDTAFTIWVSGSYIIA